MKKEHVPFFLVFRCSFGGLERIDLLRDLFDFLFDMSGSRTISHKPLAGGIRIDPAVLSRRIFQNFAATFTLFTNHMTAASIKPTAFLGHEGTLRATFDALTDHKIQTPFFFTLYYFTIINARQKVEFHNNLRNSCQEKNQEN
jgi:hypothetical protein